MSKIPSSRSSNPSPRPRTGTPAFPNGNAGEASRAFRLGERVQINEKTGVIAFLGPTQFAAGEWVGVILDRAEGKNDGSCAGVRYFRTEANHGLFCRPDRVQRLNPDVVVPDFQIGDRVLVAGKKYGFLKYIGPIHVSQGIWCGVKLDEPIGKNSGKIEGRRYFRCQHRFGLFAPIHKVEKVQLTEQEKRLLARQSMISATSFNQSNDSTSDDDEDRSISPNGFPSFEPRSPLPNVDELQKQLKTLQDQYETKIREYETLISEHFVMKQNLDKLQFQLDEHRLEAMNKEEQVTIPDGFQLISNEQFERYEALEDLLAAKDKQIEERRQKEFQHEKQIRELQLQLQAEQNQFDRRLNELSAQLKHHQDVLFPQYEKEREELKSLRRSSAELEEKLREQDESIRRAENQRAALQREAERQQTNDDELRTYQTNLDEAKRKIEQIERELNEVQEEKRRADRREIEAIEELNTLLQEKERQAEQVHLQQRRQYEEELRTYETNLADATRKIALISEQLKQLDEEKLRSEHKFEETIRQLNEHSAALQSQIRQLQLEREQTSQMQITSTSASAEELRTLREENEHQTNLLKETKSLYEKELDEYQKDLELTVRERDELDEKLKEKEMLLDSAGQEFEKHMAKLLADENEKWEDERKKLHEQIDDLREEVQNWKNAADHVTEAEETNRLLTNENADLQRELREKIEQLEQTKTLPSDFEREQNALLDEINQLKKINDERNQLQQANENLRRELEAKVQEETSLKTKITEVKSEYAIEMENMQLEHEQTVLQLTAQLQQTVEKLERLENQPALSSPVNEALQQNYEDLLAQQTVLERSFQDKLEQIDQMTNQQLTSEREQSELLDQMQNDHAMEMEKMQLVNETLKAELEQVQDELKRLMKQPVRSDDVDEELQQNYEDLLAQQTSLERSYQEKIEQLEQLTNQQFTFEQERTELIEQLKKINDERDQLEQTNENLRREFEEKVWGEASLKKQLEENQMKIAEVKSEYMIEMENMQLEQAQKALQLKNQLQQTRDELERVKNQPVPSAQVDEALQQRYNDLLAQKSTLERSLQEKVAQETALQTKLGDIEVKLAMMKSESMVEIENMRYDYEQEILKLKAQLQSLQPTKGKK